jgi:predicted amidohydrolase
VKVGFVQLCPISGNKQKNLEKITGLIGDLEADLLVFPELCTTGYLFKDKEELLSLAEPISESATLSFFKDMAREKGMSMVWGMAEKDRDKAYNSSVLVTSEGEVEVYRKIHLFDQEKFLFAPGEKEPDVLEDRGTMIGMMICFDWIFPEVCRVLALKGAEVICHPSNLILPYCQPAMATRCIENRVFAITANRTGTEEKNQRGLAFTGKSQIVDPEGQVLASASSDQDEAKVVEISPDKAKNKMATEHNHLFKDRKTDLYKEICKKKI